jgi:diadenosine tetraphosphate (Ap4A) HIT family hydrolase
MDMAAQEKPEEAKPIKELEGWRRERGEMLRRIELLRREGVCYICRDLQTGEVFGKQDVIFENDRFRVVLDSYPRVEGHTIVVYKPHRDDVAQLSYEEVGPVFQMCIRVVKAIKSALGAEKVYLLTMCDGQVSHLNFQLLPRYAGNLMGYRRLAARLYPLEEGTETASLIKSALLQRSSDSQPEE